MAPLLATSNKEQDATSASSILRASSTGSNSSSSSTSSRGSTTTILRKVPMGSSTNVGETDLAAKRQRYLVVSMLGVVFVALTLYHSRALLVESESHLNNAEQGMHYNSPTTPLKCSPWDVNIDNWWQMHPDWELCLENSTHTCFRHILNPQRAALLQDVYQTQYHNKDCTQVRTRAIDGIGYAAALQKLTSGFWSAYRQGYPFQVSIPRIRSGTFRWLYTPPYNTSNPHWASCQEEDHSCYFLPISNCERPFGVPESPIDKKYSKHELHKNMTKLEQYMWLKHYITRPRQVVRQHLQEIMAEEAPLLHSPCTWMHVRRADAMSERFPRNFYFVQEYLDKGNVTEGDTILLLTDDETTIEEAMVLHPQYNWVYWNRTRHRGAVRRNAHIPSNDEARDMLLLLAEIQMAGTCAKGIHGTSHMVDMFHMSMSLQHGLANTQLIRIDEDVQKRPRVDPQDFMDDLESQLQEARKAMAMAAQQEKK